MKELKKRTLTKLCNQRPVRLDNAYRQLKPPSAGSAICSLTWSRSSAGGIVCG